MTNPYIQTLVEMGYDKQDCEVASTMFQKHTFPCVIHGRQFDTEEQYYAELHEYMNGM
jgi:effector-binding domain-containing protein